MLCADDSFKIEDTEQFRRELESEMLKSEPDIDLVEELVSLINIRYRFGISQDHNEKA